MSYYSQKIIDGTSEDVLKNIVLNTPYHGINTDIQLFRNKRMYYTIQHFITKCIINKTITPTAQQYINRIYEDFLNKPWDYANSPLLNNHIIDIVFKDQASKVKQYRNNYYSESVAQKLYKERNKRELTDEERKNTIIINNREMTIEDFLVNYAIPRMDTHQRITIGNEKIRIGDIIYKINKNNQKEVQDMLDELSNKEKKDSNNLLI